MTTFWISKYALSTGIFSLDLDVESDESGYLSCVVREPRYQHHFYGRKDWHRTEAKAIERAECMRAAKIVSLTRQIATLRAKRFDS